MNSELDKLNQYAKAIRVTLDEVNGLVFIIDESIARIAVLRPDLATTLVSDSILRCHIDGVADDDGPSITATVRLPFGVGLCVWPSGRPAASHSRSDGLGTKSPYFVPYYKSPPLLRRLLIPQLEQLLDALRLHIER